MNSEVFVCVCFIVKLFVQFLSLIFFFLIIFDLLCYICMFYVRGFFPSLVAIWAHGVVGPFPPWWEGFLCTGRSPPRGLFPWIFPPQQPNEAGALTMALGWS